MRHRKTINHLGRTASHRKAMLANMAASLILHKRISTTTAKAKELRMYVEPLITKSKDDSTHSRRMVFSYLQSKEAVSELFREISPKIAERPGGYTRILKTGARLGDNADMCIIELVDYNENMLSTKGEAAGKSTRRRRKTTGKAKEETAAAAVAPKAKAVKEVKEEEVVDVIEETKAESEVSLDENKKNE
ncbi:MAG: 50S ribosomal protein L17 [Bacteroidota bacterium]|nr:MAG: 50S ribosomal protein L17 [Bacteroidota bacterium]